MSPGTDTVWIQGNFVSGYSNLGLNKRSTAWNERELTETGTNFSLKVTYTMRYEQALNLALKLNFCNFQMNDIKCVFKYHKFDKKSSWNLFTVVQSLLIFSYKKA